MVKIFEFKNKKYILDKEYWEKEFEKNPMLNSTLEFQISQFEYLFEIKDYTSIKNRINNMLKWGGLNEVN